MKIVAVVVTFNRKNLLKKCIEALQEQKNLQSILIIDNNSTDGTSEYVNSIKCLNIVSIRLKENIGGAGGFAEGIDYAFRELGADYVWLMDDDGVPSITALLELEKHINDYDILNALVLNEANHEELAFNVSINGVVKEHLSEIKDIKLIDNEASPFNSTLISKLVYEKIGLPNKHYFIWGDEAEYILRAKKNNMKIGTVCDAIHFHPMKKNQTEKVLFGLLGSTDKIRDWKYFWYIRNRLDFLPKYYGWRYTIRWLFAEFVKNIFTYKFNATVDLVKAIKAMVWYKLHGSKISNYA